MRHPQTRCARGIEAAPQPAPASISVDSRVARGLIARKMAKNRSAPLDRQAIPCPFRRLPVLRQGAFTLVEVLIVVVILSITLTIALPSFGKLGGRTQLRSTSHLLITAFNQARIDAVTRQHHVVVCPSADGQACSRSSNWHLGWIAFADFDHDQARGSAEPLITTAGDQPAGVAILATRGRPLLDYRPDGSAIGTNQTLTLCDRRAPDAALAVIISQAGRVRSAPASAPAAAACLQAAS